MVIPGRARNEGVVEYAERLSKLYAETQDSKARKLKGQFFTPMQIGRFMASHFEIQNDNFSLLDPGAGSGCLIASFCEKILELEENVDMKIDAFENDPDIIPFLKATLDACKKGLEENGHTVNYNIFEQDFILSNKGYLWKYDLTQTEKKYDLYDFIISNPPYYKLNKDSPESVVMKELVSGQPNIYALFMALSASMLKTNGQMVFITPRSFCSGLYYKKFRKWFLNNVQITNIHIFESRKEIFDHDEVLQENIIIKAKKSQERTDDEKWIISLSKNKNLKDIKKIEVLRKDAIHPINGEMIIRIPTSQIDLEVMKIVDKWPKTLKGLGLEISTGPVVPFRAKKYLLPDFTNYQNSAPLLWMQNMKNMNISWPLKGNKKESAIKICSGTESLLIPVKNYVLLKRFSSKEQKRRLYAGVFLKDDFPHKVVGIENHLNYIYRPKGDLQMDETLGIAAILNSTIIDRFFRALNGNTQVNATDIRSLPLPAIEKIRKIGKLVNKSQTFHNGLGLDKIVAECLEIDLELVERINRGENQDD